MTSTNAQRQRNWRRKTKELIVEMKGGCCTRCGYNKCIAALEFHHPEGEPKKDRSLLMNIRSLDKVIEDVQPLILMCANCHAEEHYNGE